MHLISVTLVDPSVKFPIRLPNHLNAFLMKTPDGWRFNSYHSDDVVKAMLDAQLARQGERNEP